MGHDIVYDKGDPVHIILTKDFSKPSQQHQAEYTDHVYNAV